MLSNPIRLMTGHRVRTSERSGVTLCGRPAYFQFDLSGMKNFPIGERVKVQFRADIFNLFNHPNFANPDGGICTGSHRSRLWHPRRCCTPQSQLRAYWPDYRRRGLYPDRRRHEPADTILTESYFLIRSHGDWSGNNRSLPLFLQGHESRVNVESLTSPTTISLP